MLSFNKSLKLGLLEGKRKGGTNAFRASDVHILLMCLNDMFYYSQT